MSRKKHPKKRKNTVRSSPWHKALEEPILTQVIRPLLEVVSQKGFTNKRDLRRSFESAYQCGVSQETFDYWLRSLDLYDTVTGTTLRTLDGSPPISIGQHPDAPGQLGLGGQPIGRGNEDGFTRKPSTMGGEADEVNFDESIPSTPSYDESVLRLAPSGVPGPTPTSMGVFGAPPGTPPITM